MVYHFAIGHAVPDPRLNPGIELYLSGYLTIEHLA